MKISGSDSALIVETIPAKMGVKAFFFFCVNMINSEKYINAGIPASGWVASAARVKMPSVIKGSLYSFENKRGNERKRSAIVKIYARDCGVVTMNALSGRRKMVIIAGSPFFFKILKKLIAALKVMKNEASIGTSERSRIVNGNENTCTPISSSAYCPM